MSAGDVVGRARVIVDPDVSGFAAKMQSESSTVERALAGIGAGLVAAGAGAEAFARSQQDTTVELARVAAISGQTEESLRELTAETQNATFSVDAVTGTFAALTRQGVRTRDDLQRTANVWDLVADATGESVVALAEASTGLRAVGIAAEEPEQALDALGFIFTNTTSTAGEFLGFIERMGPELRDLDLDINSTAAIMGVLETEFGLTGRTARTQFREAVNEADGSLDRLLSTLGISQEQFAATRGEVEGSASALEDVAARFAETRTPIQRLQALVAGLGVRFGGLGEAAGTAGSVLGTAGTALLGFSQISRVLPSILAGARRALDGLGSALGSRSAGVIGKMFLAAAAGAALGEGISKLVDPQKNFRGDRLAADLELVALGAQGASDDLITLIASLDLMVDPSFAQRLSTGVGGFLNTISFGLISDPLDRFRDGLSGIDAQLASLVSSGDADAAAGQFDVLVRGASGLGIEVEDLLELLPQYQTAVDLAAGRSGAAAGDVDGLAGSLGGVAGEADNARQSMKDLADELRAQTDPVFRLFRAFDAVEKAQKAFNDAELPDDKRRAVADLGAAVIDVVEATSEAEALFGSTLPPALVDAARALDVTGEALETLETLFGDTIERGEEFAKPYRATAELDIAPAVGNLDQLARDLTGFRDRAADGFVEAGRRIVDRLAQGIGERAAGPTVQFRRVMEGIRAQIPASPAREGPLSGTGDPLLGGAEIVRRLAAGIASQSDLPAAAFARAVTLGAPVLGGDGGSASSTSIVVNANVASEERVGRRIVTELSDSFYLNTGRALA